MIQTTTQFQRDIRKIENLCKHIFIKDGGVGHAYISYKPNLKGEYERKVSIWTPYTQYDRYYSENTTSLIIVELENILNPQENKNTAKSLEDDIKDFLEVCINKIVTAKEKEILAFYDTKVRIELLGQKIAIPFDTVIYHAIIDAVKEYKQEL